MNAKKESSLRKLASACLNERYVDAWSVYKERASKRYDEQDDGTLTGYLDDAAALFLSVARNTKGSLRRRIRTGQIPMPDPEIPGSLLHGDKAAALFFPRCLLV